MLTVEEALAAILTQAHRLPIETISLWEATGRTLAEDVDADIDLPPFANSAVDGYAVRAVDTAGASQQMPVMLRALTDVPAGAQADEKVLPGTAVRIMTGAPVPPEADAIVMVEDTLLVAGEGVQIFEAARPGQHVRNAGEDMGRGTRALSAGVLIRPAEVAMLAAVGKPEVRVYRQPRVAVFSTGDELVDVEAGVPPPSGKIRDTNLYSLVALVREAGALVYRAGRLPDDMEATMETLRACVALGENEQSPDAIVTAGGVSMGDRDYVRPALERLGTLDLWKVAMKPGKPLAFGSIGKILFFGLPGNPVSAQITFELFARPALWKMAGRTGDALNRIVVQAMLLEPLRHVPGRREYVRAITTTQDGRFCDAADGGRRVRACFTH